MVVRENPSRSAVSEILRPVRLAPTTIPRSKSLKSPFFPILMLGLNFSKLSSTSSTTSRSLNALSCKYCMGLEWNGVIKWNIFGWTFNTAQSKSNESKTEIFYSTMTELLCVSWRQSQEWTVSVLVQCQWQRWPCHNTLPLKLVWAPWGCADYSFHYDR